MELLRRYGCDELADRLDSLPPPEVALVREGGKGELNIDLGGGRRLYAGGAQAYAAGQADQFLRDPKRINVDAPETGGEFIKREGHLYEKAYARFGRPAPGTAPIAADGGYLISFGLGLGLHLPLLVEALPVRHLVVAEQFVEFLQLSLQLDFWEPMLATLESRGGGVRFAVEPDPSALSNEVYRAVRGAGFTMIDGSYAIQHYNSPVLKNANAFFREQLPTLGFSKGFFEDECLMLRNGLVNMKKPGWKRFSGIGKPLSDVPVFVIGSGPSIDQSIDAIRRNRDRAVVISGGTGLSVLLKNGMRPDLHCEIENVPTIHEALSANAADSVLKNLPLVASTTVDPRVAEAFGEKVLYFRDSVIPTRLFAEPGETLGLSGPTVTNLATRVALALGARDIYFFGVDLGSPDPDRHHAESSVYNQTDDPYWRSGRGMDALRLEVPGNRRERAYTNLPFLQTRTYFNALIASFPDTTFWNCGDGIAIAGATPSDPGTLHLEEQGGGGRAMVGRWLNDLPDGQGIGLAHVGRLVESRLQQDISTFRAAVDRWYGSAFGAIEPKACGEKNPAALIDTLAPHVGEEEDLGADAAAKALFAGTTMLMLQFGYFMYRRVEAARKSEFTAFFQAELAAELQAMHADALAEIDELLA